MGKVSELSVEEIKRRLKIQQGLEEDELNVLYPTEDALREFHRESLKIKDRKGSRVAGWADDDFVLPPEEAAEIDEINRVAHATATANLGLQTGVSPDEASAAARAASEAISEVEDQSAAKPAAEQAAVKKPVVKKKKAPAKRQKKKTN